LTEHLWIYYEKKYSIANERKARDYVSHVIRIPSLALFVPSIAGR